MTNADAVRELPTRYESVKARCLDIDWYMRDPHHLARDLAIREADSVIRAGGTVKQADRVYQDTFKRLRENL